MERKPLEITSKGKNFLLTKKFFYDIINYKIKKGAENE